MADTVRFPGRSQDVAAEDLAAPAIRLLTNISLLGTVENLAKADGIAAAITGPPQSVAIIQSGSTALAKWWSATLAGSATLTAAVAASKGIWSGEHDSVRIAILAGGGVVLAAISIALGLIVSGDVKGRAAGAVAIVQARAAVANTFLALSRPPQGESAPGLTEALLSAAALGSNVRVQLSGQTGWGIVTGIRFNPDEKVQLHVDDDWVPIARVIAFSTR